MANDDYKVTSELKALGSAGWVAFLNEQGVTAARVVDELDYARFVYDACSYELKRKRAALAQQKTAAATAV